MPRPPGAGRAGRRQAVRATSDFSGPPALLTWASADCGDEFMGAGVFVAGMLLPHIYPVGV